MFLTLFFVRRKSTESRLKNLQRKVSAFSTIKGDYVNSLFLALPLRIIIKNSFPELFTKISLGSKSYNRSLKVTILIFNMSILNAISMPTCPPSKVPWKEEFWLLEMFDTLILTSTSRYGLKNEIAFRPLLRVNQTTPVEIDCECNDLVWLVG